MKIFKKKIIEFTIKDAAKVYLIWQSYKIGEKILEVTFGPSINRYHRKINYKNDLAKIKRLYNKGWPTFEIAEEMNLSEDVIRTAIKEIKES